MSEPNLPGEAEEGSPEGPAAPGDELSEQETLEYAREDTLDFLEGLLESMGLHGSVTAEVAGEEIVASVVGEDLGLLIGRHGLTLNAVQELLRAAVQHQAGERVRVTLDIEGYRERRRETVESYALEMAQRVVEQGGEVELDPMPPFERKVVHEAVAGIEGVTSFSEGDEPNRRVVLKPED